MGDIIYMYNKMVQSKENLRKGVEMIMNCEHGHYMERVTDLQRLLNNEIKDNARLRAEISRLKWRLKGEE